MDEPTLPCWAGGWYTEAVTLALHLVVRDGGGATGAPGQSASVTINVDGNIYGEAILRRIVGEELTQALRAGGYAQAA